MRAALFFIVAAANLAPRGASAQDGVPSWVGADSLWRVEVVLNDPADGLTQEERALLADCATNGLAALATNYGFAGIAHSILEERLYYEVTVLPNESGLTAYLTFAVRDGDKMRPVSGAESEVPGTDVPTLCAGIQGAPSMLDISGQ